MIENVLKLNVYSVSFLVFLAFKPKDTAIVANTPPTKAAKLELDSPVCGNVFAAGF